MMIAVLYMCIRFYILYFTLLTASTSNRSSCAVHRHIARICAGVGSSSFALYSVLLPIDYPLPSLPAPFRLP